MFQVPHELKKIKLLRSFKRDYRILTWTVVRIEVHILLAQRALHYAKLRRAISAKGVWIKITDKLIIMKIKVKPLLTKSSFVKLLRLSNRRIVMEQLEQTYLRLHHLTALIIHHSKGNRSHLPAVSPICILTCWLNAVCLLCLQLWCFDCPRTTTISCPKASNMRC